MTEPENFEDDLFADLYNDDDVAPKPAPSSQPAPDPAPAQAAPDPLPPRQDPGQTQDEQPYDDQDDDDDDVDFNLGGDASNGYAPKEEDFEPPAPQFTHSSLAPRQATSSKEDGKMFIGGLNWETTDQSLRDYFSQFGEVVECTVMRDNSTGRSRGFGFLTFKDAKTVNTVMVKEHYLDGKIIDPKRAIPRDEQEKTSKIFVGGVSQETTDQEFRDYFAQFGRVVDATLMMDKDTGRPRGFGFVTFESEAGVEACINTPLEIHGKPIEVKKAQPRGNMREEEETTRRNKFRKTDDEEGGSAPQGAMAQMNQGGMTPQVMAQYMQRMQHYFAMMQQQQMAMSRGMAPMNPMMMQQMMMAQQMQNQMMGRGGGGGGGPQGGANMMNNMTPAMMQQMQQMQQQMMGGGNPQSPGVVAGNGGNNQQGYGYEQQMYEQQQRRGSSREAQQYGQGGYAMGGGGVGAPTSWEGMYDDVPQPNGGAGRGGSFQRGGGRGGQLSQPSNAPPNAPTGPKNAGKPGANYRGGGRGGGRAFHPYSRG